MKRVGIIGLGTITKHYLAGLKESSILKLTAVCDCLENAPSRDLYSAYKFYADYREMITTEALDYIIISTPPATHYEIAEYALSHEVNVIVEKPAVLCMSEYDELLKLAQKNSLIFEVMFHWQNGSEIIKFGELYDIGKISEIYVTVLDPYSADGITIDDAKVKLEGAWIDSGVNILSMIGLWLSFDNVVVNNIDVQKCKKTGLPIFVSVDMCIDGVKTNIVVDWRKHMDNKSTRIVYEGRRIDINNSAQRIEDGNNIVDCYHMERLPQHYYNYFKNYSEQPDVDLSRDIHRVLTEVAAKL